LINSRAAKTGELDSRKIFEFGDGSRFRFTEQRKARPGRFDDLDVIATPRIEARAVGDGLLAEQTGAANGRNFAAKPDDRNSLLFDFKFPALGPKRAKIPSFSHAGIFINS
jgi:hypothetical protein